MSRILSFKTASFVLIMFLVSILLTVIAPTVFAAQVQTYDDIYKKYNLKTVSKVPEGVKPIIINDEKELVRMLDAIDNSVTEHAKKAKKPIVIDLSKNNISDFSLLGTNTYIADTYQIQAPLYGKVELKVRVTDNGFQVTDAYAFTNITGFSFGFDWNESACEATIISNGHDVKAWAEGELEFYLLVDGLIKVYSKTIELDGYLTIFH